MMQDWDQIRNRFTALWQRELIDRCCVRVVANRDNTVTESKPFPTSQAERRAFYLDGETVLQRELDRIENTWFAGDAFPQIFANFGAAGSAAFFKNVHIDFNESIWMHPAVPLNAGEPFDIEADPDFHMLNQMYDVIDYLVQESRGRYFVSMPDISGNLDALAHIRGNDTLLMDLMLQPASVHRALQKVSDVNIEITHTVFDMIKACNDGGSTIGWLDTWGPGLHSQMQCDISVMLSPEMFQEFTMPELQLQSRELDFALYHLDGREQVRHLDMLLEIPELDMIQWTNVAGQPSPVEFIGVFQKIQRAGKCLLLKLSRLDEIEPLMRNLSSKGLFINIDVPLDSKAEADAVVKLVERLTHD